VPNGPDVEADFMTPLERYQKYTTRLLDGRAWGTLSEAKEEELLDDMDDL
jgi:hypothetical protein